MHAESGAMELNVIKPGAETRTEKVKIEKLASPGGTLPALLGDMLLALLLGSLSLRQLTDLSNADLGIKRHKGFFQNAIMGEAKLFD